MQRGGRMRGCMREMNRECALGIAAMMVRPSLNPRVNNKRLNALHMH